MRWRGKRRGGEMKRGREGEGECYFDSSFH